MFVFPQFNPIALSIGPLHIRWYGLMYLTGFLLAWILANRRAKTQQLDWSSEAIGDLIFYAALGVVIGGRVGYVIFYHAQAWTQDPLFIFKLWQGGMSFHGGLLGVCIALWYFSKKYHKSFIDTLDFTAPLVPLGLAAGRLGNFINGELWGRPTQVAWGMIFSQVDGTPRHPSQLYEFFTEGVLLFFIVWFYARQKRAPGRVSAVFLMGYACARIFTECFREPDIQRGYLAFNWLTEGQLLSVPMFIFGLWLWWYKGNENVSSITRTHSKERNIQK